MGQQKVKKIDIEKEINAQLKKESVKDKTSHRRGGKVEVSQKTEIKKEKSKESKSKEEQISESAKKEKSTEQTKTPKSKKIKIKRLRSKRYQALRSKVDRSKFYEIEEGLAMVKRMSESKFAEAIELHINLKQAKSKKQKKTKLGGSIKLPNEIKGYELNYKEDKGGNLHFIIGRKTYEIEKMKQNMEAIINALPITAKQVEKMIICSTMGPGVKIAFAGA